MISKNQAGALNSPNEMSMEPLDLIPAIIASTPMTIEMAPTQKSKGIKCADYSSGPTLIELRQEFLLKCCVQRAASTLSKLLKMQHPRPQLQGTRYRPSRMQLLRT